MIRIIFALFPAMVSVFLYGIAIYAKKSEKSSGRMQIEQQALILRRVMEINNITRKSY